MNFKFVPSIRENIKLGFPFIRNFAAAIQTFYRCVFQENSSKSGDRSRPPHLWDILYSLWVDNASTFLTFILGKLFSNLEQILDDGPGSTLSMAELKICVEAFISEYRRQLKGHCVFILKGINIVTVLSRFWSLLSPQRIYHFDLKSDLIFPTLEVNNLV